uniref:Uncharacterized protein n=1 Tax=Pristionchus pacificus TaxID=54126 RepID=A0A2A6B6X4_PRIPA|eukprot:PDM61618.1 hypothetical protein PRIPAC_51060 [Pristionchus pacificus]
MTRRKSHCMLLLHNQRDISGMGNGTNIELRARRFLGITRLRIREFLSHDGKAAWEETTTLVLNTEKPGNNEEEGGCRRDCREPADKSQLSSTSNELR